MCQRTARHDCIWPNQLPAFCQFIVAYKQEWFSPRCQQLSQGCYSHWGQLAHLTKLHLFVNTTDNTATWTNKIIIRKVLEIGTGGAVMQAAWQAHLWSWHAGDKGLWQVCCHQECHLPTGPLVAVHSEFKLPQGLLPSDNVVLFSILKRLLI